MITQKIIFLNGGASLPSYYRLPPICPEQDDADNGPDERWDGAADWTARAAEAWDGAAIRTNDVSAKGWDSAIDATKHCKLSGQTKVTVFLIRYSIYRTVYYFQQKWTILKV